MATSAGVGARRLGALTATLVTAIGLIAPAARADEGGSWSPVPPMSTPRYGAVAAPLGDGRVLVAGGLDETGLPLSSAEIYNPSSNSWSPAAPMPQPRAFAVAVLGEVYNRSDAIESGVLVSGGDLNGVATGVTEEYLPSSNTWLPGPPLNAPRAQAAALQNARSSFYDFVEGGQGTGTDPASGEAYAISPSPPHWVKTPPLDTGRIGATGAITDARHAIVAGGLDPGSSQVLTSAARSALGSAGANPWLPMPPMSTPRYLATAAPLSYNRMVVAGGSTSYPTPTALATTEIYDDNFNGWTDAAPMSTARYGAVSAPLKDGRVLVAGGSSGLVALSSAELFTPPPPPPPVVEGAPTVAIDGNSLPGNALHVNESVLASGGSWKGDSSTQYRYQWQRCRASCEDVGGPFPQPIFPLSSVGYHVTQNDLGARIRVVVTASTGTSSAPAASPQIGPVYPAGIHLLSSEHPNQTLPLGRTYVAVVRDESAASAHVHYRVAANSPHGGVFFRPLEGILKFAPGQRQIDIQVPALDHGVRPLVPALDVKLSGASGQDLTVPSSGAIALNDPAAFVRDPANPLALRVQPSRNDPLTEVSLFANRSDSLAARWAQKMSSTNASAAQALMTIANQPNAARFGPWNGPHAGSAVASYLKRAASEQPGTVPMLSTYYVVDGHCGHWADSPDAEAAYHEWIKNFAEGIGIQPAVLFLEMDSLITVGCLSHRGLEIRMRELRDAINVLSNVPHLVTYLDAGAADALSARTTARLLEQAGVSRIRGFFLNSTHFDWTSNEIRYGEAVSRMTGGKHFVVNTAENGRGPLVPRNRVKHGNEVLCNPAGRGLGPLPTWNTGFRNVDAFAWIANPGVSGGRCRPGAPPTGVFWPQLAIELVRNADYRVR